MTIGWRMKLATALVAAAAVAGIVTVVLVGAGTGSSSADSASESRKALAAVQAGALLGRLALPSGATVLTATGPAGAPDGLGGLGRPASPDLVTRTRAWTVAGSLASIRARLLAHPPRGARLTDRATSGALGAAPGTALTFSTSDPPAGIASARLGVVLAAVGPHATTVHADAEVAWIRARPASETVPASARIVDITRGVPGRRPGLVLRVTASARVAAIRRLVDELAVVQPGAVSCPTQIPGLARVTLAFRSGPAGRALARAGENADVTEPTTACDPLRFSVAGRARTPLLGGARLLRRIGALLGVRLWLAPYAA